MPQTIDRLCASALLQLILGRKTMLSNLQKAAAIRQTALCCAMPWAIKFF